MVSLLNGLEHGSAVPAAPLLAGHYIFAVGMVLLGIAVWRGRLAPRWAGILVAFVAGVRRRVQLGQRHGLPGQRRDRHLGFAALGWRILTAPDASWDAPPEPARQRHPSAI